MRLKHPAGIVCDKYINDNMTANRAGSIESSVFPCDAVFL